MRAYSWDYFCARFGIFITLNDLAIIIGINILVCIILQYAFKCKSRRQRYQCIAFAITYFIVVLQITVLSRSIRSDLQYDLIPFNSYFSISDYRTEVLIENFLNMLLLVPLGILICYLYNQLNLNRVIVSGLLISFCVEIIQFVSKRGCFETDDLIHNTIGFAIGYYFTRCIIIIKNRQKHKEERNRQYYD